MSDHITVEVDTKPLLEALDRVGKTAERLLKAAEKVTAERVRDEARARVARRTGQTADNIQVQESYDGTGYVVLVNVQGTDERRDRPGQPRWAHLASGLEQGTIRQAPQPFLGPAAKLEEGPHHRRMLEALQDAIDDGGLGE